MSTVYRKSGNRIYYKVEGNFVTRVTDKFMEAGIAITRNALILCEAMQDAKESTAEEFNTAYKEAIARIQMGRLDI